MPYTQSQLEYTRDKRPEFRLKPVPKLDEVIVKFLEKFEVFVKPATSSKRDVGSDAISGAITGMAGADVGGDAFLISGQKNRLQFKNGRNGSNGLWIIKTLSLLSSK